MFLSGLNPIRCVVLLASSLEKCGVRVKVPQEKCGVCLLDIKFFIDILCGLKKCPTFAMSNPMLTL